jgi:hypothetical protein
MTGRGQSGVPVAHERQSDELVDVLGDMDDEEQEDEQLDDDERDERREAAARVAAEWAFEL